MLRLSDASQGALESKAQSFLPFIGSIQLDEWQNAFLGRMSHMVHEV